MTTADFEAFYRQTRARQIAEERRRDAEALAQYQADCLRSWEGRK